MSTITIRNATKDSQTIFNFIMELAIYEKAPNEVKTTVSEIEKSLFSPNATAKALICEEDGIAIGFAVYFYNYSTWLGKKGIYLEDLYVSESKRKRGAGKALLKFLAQKAIEELNGAEISGRPIVVNEAKPREERPSNGGGYGQRRDNGFRRNY